MPFLAANDRHVSAVELQALVSRERILIALDEGTACGWLRWSLFWDDIPFMNMLFVLPSHRGRGIGKDLVIVWEESCKANGHAMVLTSTLVTESAQHLYRHLGFQDVGHLDLPGEARELILLHRI